MFYGLFFVGNFYAFNSWHDSIVGLLNYGDAQAIDSKRFSKLGTRHAIYTMQDGK